MLGKSPSALCYISFAAWVLGRGKCRVDRCFAYVSGEADLDAKGCLTDREWQDELCCQIEVLGGDVPIEWRNPQVQEQLRRRKKKKDEEEMQRLKEEQESQEEERRRKEKKERQKEEEIERLKEEQEQRERLRALKALAATQAKEEQEQLQELKALEAQRLSRLHTIEQATTLKALAANQAANLRALQQSNSALAAELRIYQPPWTPEEVLRCSFEDLLD